MKTAELTLQDERELKEAFSQIDTLLSEYSFANLYLFRDKHDYQLLHFDDFLFVTGKTYSGDSYIMPTVDLNDEESVEYLAKLKSLAQNYDMIFPIPENWLHHFPSDEYSYNYEDEDSDYLYTVEKLATFPGRHLHGKRNLLKQFHTHYNGRVEKLTSDNIETALYLLEKWQTDSGFARSDTDFNACLEAITRFESLELDGTIYYIDETPVGFTLCEKTTANDYVIHFAKGKREIKGLYQFMFSTIATANIDNIKYINMEQDLGQESLRTSKRSYRPDVMGHKYRVKSLIQR